MTTRQRCVRPLCSEPKLSLHLVGYHQRLVEEPTHNSRHDRMAQPAFLHFWSQRPGLSVCLVECTWGNLPNQPLLPAISPSTTTVTVYIHCMSTTKDAADANLYYVATWEGRRQQRTLPEGDPGISHQKNFHFTAATACLGLCHNTLFCYAREGGGHGESGVR